MKYIIYHNLRQCKANFQKNFDIYTRCRHIKNKAEYVYESEVDKTISELLHWIALKTGVQYANLKTVFLNKNIQLLQLKDEIFKENKEIEFAPAYDSLIKILFIPDFNYFS